MLYLLLSIVVLLIAFNAYASRLAVRSRLNDRWQTRAQLLLIWLVPFVGSLLTIHVHKEYFRGSWFREGAAMEPEQTWHLPAGRDDCPPGNSDCGE